MTTKTTQIISARKAHELLEAGAVLVDIREAPERNVVIPGARHAPMSALASQDLDAPSGPLIFHCRSGRRTAMNAGLLQAQAGGCDVYLVDGGIDAWAAEGLPVRSGAA